MQLDHTHLKVDQTVLHYGENLLLVSNINIPVHRLTTDLALVLERADDFVRRDYVNLPHHDIHYQVCASYDLRNTATGEIRHWSGSFNPRGNRFNILCDFQVYSPALFKAEITRACQPNNVYNKLRFFHVQTAWVFDRLTSVIVSVQAQVGALHPTIENRGLLGIRNGARERVHVTFLLT